MDAGGRATPGAVAEGWGEGEPHHNASKSKIIQPFQNSKREFITQKTSSRKTNMNKILIINPLINNIGFRFCELAFRLKQSSSLSRWRKRVKNFNT